MKPLRILASSPTSFHPPLPEFAANLFEIEGRALYEQDPEGFRKACLEEHSAQIDFLKNRRLADIVYIPQQHDTPDSVFTRDGSISVVIRQGKNTKPISIIAKFTNPARHRESDMHREALTALNDNRVIHQSPYALEGGDIQLDRTRKIFWGGYHPNPTAQAAHEGRTSLDAHSFISEKTGIPFASLQTWSPRYHLDTFLGVAPKGELVVCFAGMSKANRDAIMVEGFEKPNMDPKDFLIEVSAEEADRFATNFLGVNGNIIMPQGNPRLAGIFSERGYDVDQFPMRYISAGGGSSHCSFNDIDTEIVLDDELTFVNGMA
ncbi:MAG: hypothetical protein JKY71_03430 [Alphaproteobacteria bacterium]|nr:hypothetical protein [Alphaproteobacteria bacterium]